LKGIFVHEIGHNLGGIHGDPGSILDYTQATETSSRSGTGSSSGFTQGSNVYYYRVSKVNEDGVRAIIGRVGLPRSVVSSKYIKPNEEKKITKTLEEEGAGNDNIKRTGTLNKP
jgi:hypothetical protein